MITHEFGFFELRQLYSEQNAHPCAFGMSITRPTSGRQAGIRRQEPLHACAHDRPIASQHVHRNQFTFKAADLGYSTIDRHTYIPEQQTLEPTSSRQSHGTCACVQHPYAHRVHTHVADSVGWSIVCCSSTPASKVKTVVLCSIRSGLLT